MSRVDYAPWLDSVRRKAKRYSILFLQLGACHEPARRALSDSGMASFSIEEYLEMSELPEDAVLVLRGIESLLDQAGLTSLGILRDRVMTDVDAGKRVILLSRSPRVAFPLVPGSSLFDDAGFARGPDLSISSPEQLPSCLEDGLSPETVIQSALSELGPDACASLDRAIYENMLSGERALSMLSARELEAIDGAGLTTLRDGIRVWSFPKHPWHLKLALDETMAKCVEPQLQLADVSGGLWTIERSIRMKIRERAMSAWDKNWRVQCLNGDLSTRVLNRATESAYPAAKSVKELRDPLEWLTLGELLEVRKRREIGNLGLQPALWHQFASQLLPIRNRLSHMRTLRPQDSDEVIKWLRVIERKLSAEAEFTN